MPIYTYRCDSCGIQFERQQGFHDQPLTRCPECNKKSLKKVYAPVGILFKGSGFYATDHKSPSGQSAARGDKEKKEATGETAPAAKSESKTENKPEAKKD
ncbi:MAG: zinc ribbon domain-containing protein [Chloroflexi bacterium]|nr:zinc ribbon domain-containing protein [Chloroflexota bacterium]